MLEIDNREFFELKAFSFWHKEEGIGEAGVGVETGPTKPDLLYKEVAWA